MTAQRERSRSPWQWGHLGSTCHFCYLRPAAWRYPTLDSQEEPPELDVSGDWIACDVCHALIDSGRRDELARQLAEIVRDRVSGVGCEDSYRKWFDEFWARRTGPAVRYEWEGS